MRTSFKINGDSGSVLMEFIVVLPIYMLLLGFAFVIGELGLQSVHLAGSADRTYAVSPSDFGRFKAAASPNKDDHDGEDDSELEYKNDPVAGDTSARASEYDTKRIDQVASEAENFNGPWSKAVAAYVKDNYTLTPVSRGFIAYWYRQKFSMTDEPQSAIDSGDSVLGQMLDNGIGRTDMVGKDLWDEADGKERPFGYYSLQRNEPARSGSTGCPYRKWPAGQLEESSNWEGNVRDEAWATLAYETLPDRDGFGNIGEPPSADPGVRSVPWRDYDLDRWSD